MKSEIWEETMKRVHTTHGGTKTRTKPVRGRKGANKDD